ncbi:hypothetical protein EE612_000162 [Oryza sativa]|nr:hypothetical protein EE612_000162 [Oryza sativa]
MLRKATRGSASPAHLHGTKPPRHFTESTYGTEALLGLGFGEFPGGGGWEVVPDAEGGGAVVDDDGGGAREAGEVGLPVRAVPRRHAGRRRRARRRRRRRG